MSGVETCRKYVFGGLGYRGSGLRLRGFRVSGLGRFGAWVWVLGSVVGAEMAAGVEGWRPSSLGICDVEACAARHEEREAWVFR